MRCRAPAGRVRLPRRAPSSPVAGAPCRGRGPRAVPAVASLCPPTHHRQRQAVVAQRDEAGRVHPVLERAPPVARPAAAVVVQQPVEVVRVVGADPAHSVRCCARIPPAGYRSAPGPPVRRRGSGHRLRDAGSAAAARTAAARAAPRHAPHPADRRSPIGRCPLLNRSHCNSAVWCRQCDS